MKYSETDDVEAVMVTVKFVGKLLVTDTVGVTGAKWQKEKILAMKENFKYN